MFKRTVNSATINSSTYIKHLVASCVLGLFFICENGLCCIDDSYQPSKNEEELVYFYNRLRKEKDDNLLKIQYLVKFPRKFDQFKKVFDRKDFCGLYGDSHEYIKLFTHLEDTYPELVGSIFVNLAKEAKYSADAPAYLRVDLMWYAIKNTGLFIKILSLHDENAVQGVVNYLSDVKNFYYDSQYEKLLTKLDNAKFRKYYERFEKAQLKRIEEGSIPPKRLYKVWKEKRQNT